LIPRIFALAFFNTFQFPELRKVNLSVSRRLFSFHIETDSYKKTIVAVLLALVAELVHIFLHVDEDERN
jgi:hypothetical protein